METQRPKQSNVPAQPSIIAQGYPGSQPILRQSQFNLAPSPTVKIVISKEQKNQNFVPFAQNVVSQQQNMAYLNSSKQLKPPIHPGYFASHSRVQSANPGQQMRTESRIQYVPYERVVTEYEEVRRQVQVPITKKVTDYYAVQYDIEYVPQVFQEKIVFYRYQEYVPQERVAERVEYKPITKQQIVSQEALSHRSYSSAQIYPPQIQSSPPPQMEAINIQTTYQPQQQQYISMPQQSVQYNQIYQSTQQQPQTATYFSQQPQIIQQGSIQQQQAGIKSIQQHSLGSTQQQVYQQPGSVQSQQSNQFVMQEANVGGGVAYQSSQAAYQSNQAAYQSGQATYQSGQAVQQQGSIQSNYYSQQPVQQFGSNMQTFGTMQNGNSQFQQQSEMESLQQQQASLQQTQRMTGGQIGAAGSLNPQIQSFGYQGAPQRDSGGGSQAPPKFQVQPYEAKKKEKSFLDKLFE